MRDFERIYAEHAQPLLRFLIFRIGDRALAEDIAADTFERVLRSRARFDPRRSAEKTWIYSIALNLVRDHARRSAVAARAQQLSPARAPSSAGADPAESAEARDLVRRGMASLSPEEREAIALRYGADLSLPEIAKLSNERLTTIEGRVYRGLRKLKAALD